MQLESYWGKEGLTNKEETIAKGKKDYHSSQEVKVCHLLERRVERLTAKR